MKVAALDMDAFIAKAEGRSRLAQPGESVDAGRLALNLSTMPEVTNKVTPVAKEVSAMADWLFSNVQWVKDASATNSVAEGVSEAPGRPELEIA